MATIKLGEMLLKAKVLKEGQLRQALSEQQKQGGRLGEVLVRLSLVTEDLLVRALSRQLGLPVTDLDMVREIPPEARAKLPKSFAATYEAIPLRLGDGGKLLTVAMADPQNLDTLEKLKATSGCRISPHIAARSAIGRALRRLYDPSGGMELPEAEESSFKVLDAQGMMREAVERLTASASSAALPTQPEVRRSNPFPAESQIPGARLRATPSRPQPTTTQNVSPPPPVAGDPLEVVKNLEAVQRKEVAALKAMVELLIERRVFTRDEYLAKLKGSGS